jgi:DNA-binding GntR family transcriptional regulator
VPPHVKLESPQPAHPLHRSYKSIGEMLTEDLRKAILSGAVEEGEYLRQRSLARRYGVSEVVVREALRHLEAEGLVETEPRKGARASRLSAAEVKELWELRIQLEKLLTQHAVPAFQPEDLARVDELIHSMSQERDPIAWLTLNRELHDRLYRPSGRLRILRFANNLRNLIDRYLRMRLGVLQHYGIAHREHRSILAAYRKGNAALAVKRVEAHLQRTADSVVAFLTARKK